MPHRRSHPTAPERGHPCGRSVGWPRPKGSARSPLGDVLEFLRALWGVNHGLESISRRMRSRLRVTGPERMVVRLVGRYPGVSAGDLARILHVHPSTLTGLLKRLVSRSVVTRRAHLRDGRIAHFTLTSNGKAIDRVRRGTVEAAIARALGSLPAGHVQTAQAVLETLRSVLEGS